MGSAARGVGAVLLLLASNAFMNVAWYLHLKFHSWPIVKAIFLSWLIAFFEYCLQVPANRMGHFSSGGPFTAPQLKTIQEFLTLSTFTIFSITVLKEKLRWSDGLAFALIFSGVVVGLVLNPKSASRDTDVALPPPPVAPEPEPAPSGSPETAAPAAAGRKLLQLLPLAWRGRAGASSSGSSGAAVVQLGQQARREKVDDPQQQQQAQEEQVGLDLAVGGLDLAVGQARSSSQGQQLVLLARQGTLHSQGSAAVLLASGADVHISSSRQGTHQREHPQPTEGAGESGDSSDGSSTTSSSMMDGKLDA